MNIHQAKKLLQVDFRNYGIEKLRKHYVKLIDAWRESKAEYGFAQAVKDGFYKIIASESASGFSPADIWLTHNLEQRLHDAEALLTEQERMITDES